MAESEESVECDLIKSKRQMLHEYNNFEDEEIEVNEIEEDIFNEDNADNFDFNSLKQVTGRDEVVPIIIHEKDIPHVVEIPSTFYTCSNCLMTFKQKKFLNKHITKCTIDDNWLIRKFYEESNVPLTYDVPTKLARDENEKNVQNESRNFLKSSLEKIIKSPINNICVGALKTPGNILVDLANDLLKKLEFEEEIADWSKKMVMFLFKLLPHKKSNYSAAAKEKIWSNINEFLHKSHLREELFIHLSIEICSDNDTLQLFFVEIVLSCFNEMLTFINAAIEPEYQETKLSKEEEQIVCYVSGYVVFSLKKKYRRLQRNNAMRDIALAAIQCLHSIQPEGELTGETFEEYVCAWTALKSRGGLIKINQLTFDFFHVIETVVKSVLTIKFLRHYKGEDIREALYIRISENEHVEQKWESLSRIIVEDEMKSILKKQIVMKWIDIRARSYVRTYVQLLKHNKEKKENAPSQVGEPSLRKQLYKSK